jgi:hypothetical protein
MLMHLSHHNKQSYKLHTDLIETLSIMKRFSEPNELITLEIMHTIYGSQN